MSLPHHPIKVDDYYEQTRFKLVLNLCWFLIILLSLITLQNLSNASYVKLPNLVGIAAGIVGLIILKKSNSHKVVAIFLSLSAFTILTATFFGVRNTLHYTTPLYMIMNILFTFFTLKRKWGFAMLSAHFIGMIFFFYFRMVPNLEGLEPYDSQDLLTFSTEYTICGAGIGYMIYLFLKTSNYAESALKMSNDSLNDKNSIISQQNDEMAIMLKEIHHRVKNNLQVITSMLRLQANSVEGKHPVEFEDAINRINAMSLIHEKLYQSHMLTHFDLQNYLDELTTGIVNNNIVKSEIKFNVITEFNKISAKTIVPLALLYNELLTNSIKHAFENIEVPCIDVHLYTISNQQFKLIYKDNGIWKNQSSESFGLDLIEAMTEQLDGKYELDKSETGTTYIFELTNLKD